MRKNPIKSSDFLFIASHDLQVAADLAAEQTARFPDHPGYRWVRPLVTGQTLAVDLLEPVGSQLLAAGGDLTQLSPTLIPEGGVVCPGGSFPFDTVSPAKKASDLVVIEKAFAVGKYPVTQGLYAVVQQTQAQPDKKAHPVREISWRQAIAFCNALSDMLGLDPVYVDEGVTVSFNLDKNGFRLPTAKEWQYAARSGGDNLLFAGSDDPMETAWYAGNTFSVSHPVGTRKPNSWGLYDMCGNVREYLHSVYRVDKQEVRKGVFRPVGTDRDFYVEMSGGSTQDEEDDLAVFARHLMASRTSYWLGGFRLCRTLP